MGTTTSKAIEPDGVSDFETSPASVVEAIGWPPMHVDESCCDLDIDDDEEWVKIEWEDAIESSPASTASTDVPFEMPEDVSEVSERDPSEPAESGGVLDERAFPCFAELLAASQAYASHSGCRFRSIDFADVTDEAEDNECRIKAAKARASPIIRDFTARLTAGEQRLKEEMGRAFDVVMMEGVRNAMVAAFREVDLWPPPENSGVDEGDCDFEDLSAPIPIIAQRAYNDEIHRNRDAASGGGAGFGHFFRRATTASYLVDFAHEVNAPLQISASSSRHVTMLQEFGKNLEQWEREQGHGSSVSSSTVSKQIDKLAIARTMDELRFEAAWWLSEHWRALWTFTGTILFGAAASASLSSLLRRSLHVEDKVHGALIDEPCEELCGEDAENCLV
mmetsp:Transcript_83651/g.132217  ORF Transcript_83651/g.132217 Transcript_83651/m.132217 type:complete len:392 (-) Transcript_83651:233-1408(-)